MTRSGSRVREKREVRFCSFDCTHAKAERSVSADRSCMTFNCVWCKKLKRHVPKGMVCRAEVDHD